MASRPSTEAKGMKCRDLLTANRYASLSTPRPCIVSESRSSCSRTKPVDGNWCRVAIVYNTWSKAPLTKSPAFTNDNVLV